MQRSDQQRKSIEVYCREVAIALNDAGYDLHAILEKKQLPVSCTQENIKEVIFKAILKALFPPKISTTELTTGEVKEVYEHMAKWVNEEFGIYVPWPSEETLSEEQR